MSTVWISDATGRLAPLHSCCETGGLARIIQRSGMSTAHKSRRVCVQDVSILEARRDVPIHLWCRLGARVFPAAGHSETKCMRQRRTPQSRVTQEEDSVMSAASEGATTQRATDEWLRMDMSSQQHVRSATTSQVVGWTLQ